MSNRKYYLMVDTETCNSLAEPIAYDVGYAIIDRTGKVYRTGSFIVAEIFYGEKSLMKSAYYASKIPMYIREINEGKRKVRSFFEIRRLMNRLAREFKIEAIVAHNASFDKKALDNTSLYILGENFWKYSIPYYCTLSMAESLLVNRPSYIEFCKRNSYTKSKGAPRLTAEILYRFISHNNNFIESHTGLEDVLIEKEIFAYCMRQHKTMNVYPKTRNGSH